MASLSIVLLTWNRPAMMLNNSLYTLNRQTHLPDEIIVVEASPDQDHHVQTGFLCAQYPKVRLIEAYWEKFNISRGFNAGIKRTDPASEYVLVTCMEMLFSVDFLGQVLKCVCPDCMVYAECGTLTENTPIASPQWAGDHWQELCDQVSPNPPCVGEGAIACARRDWWFKIHGYDEIRRPYSYSDVDMWDRSKRSGLQQVIVKWTEAQCIHPWHGNESELFYSVSGHYIDPQGIDKEIVRNPVQWGEL